MMRFNSLKTAIHPWYVEVTCYYRCCTLPLLREVEKGKVEGIVMMAFGFRGPSSEISD